MKFWSTRGEARGRGRLGAAAARAGEKAEGVETNAGGRVGVAPAQSVGVTCREGVDRGGVAVGTIWEGDVT